MLDPDLLALASSDFHDPRFVDSLMEARRIIEPAAAELADERAGPRDLAAMDDAYRRMCASLPHDERFAVFFRQAFQRNSAPTRNMNSERNCPLVNGPVKGASGSRNNSPVMRMTG